MMNENWGPALKQLHRVLNAGAVGGLADATLLERFLSGRGNADSSAAFAALLERHGPMVMRICRDVLRNLHDAEDASQATFLVLARNGGSIRRADSLGSWLFGVALRVAAKSRAEAARRRAIERPGSEMKTRFGNEGKRAIPCPELYDELHRLPERYRAPIVLCHLEGLTNEQAAGQLGLAVRTVQRRLAQGRERLRDRLVRRGLEPAVSLPGTGFADLAPSEPWLEATVRAASELAAGREIATVASTAVTALTQAGRTVLFAGKLKIVAAAVTSAAAVLVALLGAGGAIASRRQTEPSAEKAEAGKVATKADTEKDGSVPVVGVGPWIKGVVVDTSGRPVGGVHVSSLRSFQPRSVYSKPDGTFVIATDDPSLRYLSLWATTDGGARHGIFRFHDRTTGTKDPRTLARIVLKPARDVMVTVVDARGAPVEAATVVVLDGASSVAESRTDARGVVALRAPVDAISYWIIAYKPGVGFDYFENYVNLPSDWSALPERAELVLNGTRNVRVRAVDSAGNPVPGVEIMPMGILKKGKLSAADIGDRAKARADARGVATFEWLPADICGRTSFFVASPWYETTPFTVFDAEAPDAEVTARVVHSTPISGKVSRPDGSPAANVVVIAETQIFSNAHLLGPAKARTAADGSYAIDVRPGQSYNVAITDDEWVARSESIDVRAGNPRTGVDLRLDRGSVIRGRVTAGEPPRPARGVWVTLIEDEKDGFLRYPYRDAETDQEGRYSFRVGPGNYWLRAPDGPGGSVTQELIKVGDGQDLETSLQLSHLAHSPRTLRGTVRSRQPDGPPVSRAIVVIVPTEAGGPASQAFADGEGRFELPRPEGSALVLARDSMGNLAGFASVDNDGDREITVVARPAAIARGRVVDALGKPWVNIRVYYAVSPKRADADAIAGFGLPLMTDDLGRFTASGLFVGARCTLYAVHPTGGGHSPRKSFDVNDIQPIDLGDVVLRPR